MSRHGNSLWVLGGGFVSMHVVLRGVLTIVMNNICSLVLYVQIWFPVKIV